MKIYLAIPYTGMEEKSYDKANEVAAYLIINKHIVFSPITHNHPLRLENDDVPGTWEFWEKYDRAFLEWCDALCVVRLEGWKKSVGVQAEIKIAKELGKPIFHLFEKGDIYEFRQV